RQPMASYLAVLAVAEYEVIEDTTQNDIPLRHYIYPESDTEQMREVFSTTGLAMEILESYFGEYPYDTYGHVITPMYGGALETQTMTAMPQEIGFAREESQIWALVV